MTTAIDTNIIVALWDKDPTLSLAAQTALETAFNRGGLAVSAPVFAELMAAPGRTETFVNSFLEETGIVVEWELGEAVWRSAGRAFRSYAERRRKQRDSGTRRILADFLIGAHAEKRGYRLLTLDERLYRAAFPSITVETI
jgi:predicted nucleic acid-binding protein